MDDYSKLKIDYDKVCEENYKLKKEEIESQNNNIRNEINNRIFLSQNIRDNNNNNIKNLNEDDFNNDKKGENNVFIKNEMNQDIFDLEESNKALNEKLENLENYYKNKKNELEFKLENKEKLTNKLYYGKELLNATIETMKKKNKKMEEELSKEKSDL
jgi:hypothetical protein